MELKFLGPEDAEEISRFVHDMWVDTYAPIIIGGKPRAEEIFDEWVGPEKIRSDMLAGHFFAYVMVDGQRMGLISAGKTGEELEVSKIYILPESRHLHLGAEAMQYMLDYGRENDCSKAFLEVNPLNSVAISFYSRFGFRAEGLKAHDVGYTMIMSLRL